jgi:biopolymer transport protein ExbD
MALRRLGAAPDLAPTPSSGGVTGINVTPLLDVLLVLLVLGLVSFGISRHRLAVTAPVPEAEPAIITPVVLELHNNGGYRLNGQAIPVSQLSGQLAAVFRLRPVKILFIKPGSQGTDQEFIQVADLAREAGVMTIAVVGS